jgi:hypothetical protein
VKRLHAWLHRRGYVRVHNTTYANGAYRSALVDVVVPSKRLARWAVNRGAAGHLDSVRVAQSDHLGPLRWRVKLVKR